MSFYVGLRNVSLEYIVKIFWFNSIIYFAIIINLKLDKINLEKTRYIIEYYIKFRIPLLENYWNYKN